MMKKLFAAHTSCSNNHELHSPAKNKNQARIAGLLTAAALAALSLSCSNNAKAKGAERWQIGTPIATYWQGPAITDASATQMAQGGFNLIWCKESEMETAQKQGLRFMLQDDLLSPKSLDDPAQLAKLDALIARVKDNPKLYCYFITDEPGAAAFPGLGKLVAHLRETDPAHMAYINLLPTYATNNQLGTKGDTVTAYKEYLRQFSEIVKPDLLSYDHYHFAINGDNNQYFLNLNLMRQHSLETGVPFLNIVQACTWDKSMRAPNRQELRWLTYTSLAYGALGQSYFVYSFGPFYRQFEQSPGQMRRPDGTTTALYDEAKLLNPEFVAIASQLKPLRSIGAYHVGKAYLGAETLPEKASYHLEFSGQDDNNTLPAEGMLLGYFGPINKTGAPTHVVVVNLNYKHAVTTTLAGPGRLALFDTATGQWKPAAGPRASITLPPGSGMLVRVVK